ncbi:MAG TPA: hypothetical protein VF832_15410, partial [Longimicrobiales bacterium]
LPYLPLVVSLGALLAVLLPTAALVASMRAPRPPAGAAARRWAALAAVLAVGLGFAGALHLLLSAASNSPLLEGGSALWGGLQVVGVLLLSIIAAAAFPFAAAWRRRSGTAEATIGWGLMLPGAALAVALAVLVVTRWNADRQVVLWPALLWTLPFALMAVGLSGAPRPGQLARWGAAAWLAATAVLPYVWVSHVQARLDFAEGQVSTLGSRTDPYLDFLLRRFADEARQRYRQGENGVELLYRTWVASGFAEDAYPARIMLWSSHGLPIPLALGGAPDLESDTVAPYLVDLLNRARASSRVIIEPVRDVPTANEAMAVPLDAEHVISLVVPPRKELSRTAALAPFLGREDLPDTRLELVPVKVGLPSPPPQLAWERNDEGWRGEELVHYPDRDFHAHVQVVLPSPWVRLARASLLTALDLAIVLLLWAFGHLARGDLLAPPGGWLRVLRGFRARVTAALFLFFLLPTGAFGLVAYRALAGEVVRSARLVAENAVGQSAREFAANMGDLRALSMITGQDLLYYFGGELADASNGDALRLGVYDAWMPPPVYLALQSGEELSAAQEQQVAEHPFLVAYQRLPATNTLAVPVPLAAGETAVRQQELADVILFAVL